MQRSNALAYLLAAVALGLISTFMSENMFWSAPNPSLDFAELLLVWLAYSACCATVLSAVLLTGISGWPALFLGGALLGWLVEGVVVGTAYQVFPFQLVWTPLAWHALITSLAAGGICRAGVHWRLEHQIAGLVLFGAAVAFFAMFWPVERTDLPGLPSVLGYLVGLGLVVPLANVVLDRIGVLAVPSRKLLWIAPGIAALVWLGQSLFAPALVRLSVPVLIALTLWMMRRLGSGPAAVAFGPPAPFIRHALFLLAPLATSLLAVWSWQMLGKVATNLPFAALTCALALGLWLWLLVAAIRRRPT